MLCPRPISHNLRDYSSALKNVTQTVLTKLLRKMLPSNPTLLPPINKITGIHKLIKSEKIPSPKQYKACAIYVCTIHALRHIHIQDVSCLLSYLSFLLSRLSAQIKAL